MRRVKIFTVYSVENGSPTKLENKINEWIRTTNAKVVDVSYTTRSGFDGPTYEAMVLYET